MADLQLPKNVSIPDELRPFLDALMQRLLKLERENRELRALLHAPMRRAALDAPSQALLTFSGEEAPPMPAPKTATRTADPASCKGHGRGRLPAHLRRERIEHGVPAERLRCRDCGEDLKRFGEECTPELEYVPSSLLIREHVRGKYACPKCQGHVVTAEMPDRPILKGRPGPGLLAQVLTAKYADHLPLDRQRKIFARQGVRLPLSTLCDWVGAMEELYASVYGVMKEELLAAGLLNSDETSVLVLDGRRKGVPGEVRRGGQKAIKTGYLRTFIGGEHVVFQYAPDKSAPRLTQFLGSFEGYFQGDSSSVNVAAAQGKIVHAGCWAHARRRFDDAREHAPEQATAALAYIRALYDVEDEGKLRAEATRAGPDAPAFGPTELAALRQERSRPVLNAFHAWLDLQARVTLPKSTLGEAIHYALGQWTALTRYLEDGRLNIDNNISERNLRSVAVGRKNWLFAGSDEGALRAAVVYSLVQSCKHHGLDPFAYLRDTLPLLSTHPAAALTPKAWAARLAQLQ